MICVCSAHSLHKRIPCLLWPFLALPHQYQHQVPSECSMYYIHVVSVQGLNTIPCKVVGEGRFMTIISERASPAGRNLHMMTLSKALSTKSFEHVSCCLPFPSNLNFNLHTMVNFLLTTLIVNPNHEVTTKLITLHTPEIWYKDDTYTMATLSPGNELKK